MQFHFVCVYVFRILKGTLWMLWILSERFISGIGCKRQVWSSVFTGELSMQWQQWSSNIHTESLFYWTKWFLFSNVSKFLWCKITFFCGHYTFVLRMINIWNNRKYERYTQAIYYCYNQCSILLIYLSYTYA